MGLRTVLDRMAESGRTSATRGNATTALGVASVLILGGAGAAAALGTTNDGDTHITVHFSRAVGLYTGSQVRMLGVKVGKIGTITPEGTTVAVKLVVNKGIKVPANAIATVVPPALVSDRYIQLTVYTSGPVMPDNGQIPVSATQIPVEKDDIEADLNKLTTALGPDGANSSGSLSKLINVGAANLNGNGAVINQTLRDLSALVGTLDDNKSDLTGTVDQLDQFTQFLLKNDSNIKTLYTKLADVSTQLSDDRGALAAAFSNLSIATKALADLITQSKDNVKLSLSKLADITNLLVQDKNSLIELLDDVPLALGNLAGSFDPQTQTLDVRTNTPLMDPNGLGLLLCDALQSAPLPAAAAAAIDGPACTAAASLPNPAASGTPSLPGTGLPPGLPTLPTKLPSVPITLPGSLAKPAPVVLPSLAAVLQGLAGQATGATK